MVKVGLYVRVSTDEQKKHGLSVDNQIEALTKYAKHNKYKIVCVYNDAGFSASKSYKTRPALNKMIQDAQDKKIELILFTKLDRFFRNVPDYYAVMEKLGSVPWRAIWEDYETQTSAGKFKVNIMLSVAQSEADRTSERIKSTFEYKKARGEVCTGGVATGYKIVDKRWYKDEKTQEAVKAFFDTYLSTYSRKSAVLSAREHGLNISTSTARHMLYKPAYYGGEPYVAEPYITLEEHEKIINNKPYRTKHKKYDYIFSGLLKCSVCGYPLIGSRTIHIRKDGTEQHSVYYVCGRANVTYEPVHTSINEKLLEQYLLNNLEPLLEGYNISITSVTHSDNAKSLANAKGRLKRIKDLYELGDMDIEEYKEKRMLLLDAIAELEKEPAQKLRQLPSHWRDIYNDLDELHRCAFWADTLNYIEVTSRRCTNPIAHF